jgi:hypothetical protein
MSANPTPAATLNSAALPVRQGSLAGRGDTVQQQQGAWQREMERAQLANWFKPPVAADRGHDAVPPGRGPETLARRATNSAARASGAIVGSNPAAVGSAPGRPLEPLAVGLRIGVADVSEGAAEAPRAAVRFSAEMRPAFIAEPLLEAKAPADLQMRRGAVPLWTADGPAAASAPELEVEAADESRAQQPSASDVQPPLRLHEESMAEGQAVWIAMRADDDALAAMLPRIVADLQHGMLQDRGQRLYQVVCNGRLVWRNGFNASVFSNTTHLGGGGHPAPVDSYIQKGA